MSFKKESVCKCVTKHVPLPVRYISIDVNGAKVDLCPTARENLLSLLDAYEAHGTVPPGSVRKHYSDYIQELAKQLRS